MKTRKEIEDKIQEIKDSREWRSLKKGSVLLARLEGQVTGLEWTLIKKRKP